MIKISASNQPKDHGRDTRPRRFVRKSYPKAAESGGYEAIRIAQNYKKDEQKLIKSRIFGRCIAHRKNDTWSCSEKMQDTNRLSQHHRSNLCSAQPGGALRLQIKNDGATTQRLAWSEHG